MTTGKPSPGDTIPRSVPSDDRLVDAVHTYEPKAGERWTNGNGQVPIACLQGWAGPVELVLYQPGMISYIDNGRRHSAA